MNKLKKRLEKIEKELDKCRTSSFLDGWQTQRHSKKGRKWDVLAQEKFKLRQSLDTVLQCRYYNHNEDVFNHGRCCCCNEKYERIINQI